ncbi:hypothetical protein ACFV6D_09855 [Kitasatospora sp. NPDC059812]|uniref:hypothetical protein n=1 Tax=Kitasatospora sp. NPDC059812 TaxID=3346958 RepID=UPI0036600474
MTNFIAWVFFAWASVLLAGLIALYLPVPAGEPFQPKPPAPPIAPEPEMPALWDIPSHVIERSKPLDTEDHAPVRPYTPEAQEAPEDPSPELPRPGTVRVVPLWVAVLLEDQRQTARRRALEAASAGLPDTGYTYQGAQALIGAGA